MNFVAQLFLIWGGRGPSWHSAAELMRESRFGVAVPGVSLCSVSSHLVSWSLHFSACEIAQGSPPHPIRWCLHYPCPSRCESNRWVLLTPPSCPPPPLPFFFEVDKQKGAGSAIHLRRGRGLGFLGLVPLGQLLVLLGNKGKRNSGGLPGSGRKGGGGPQAFPMEARLSSALATPAGLISSCFSLKTRLQLLTVPSPPRASGTGLVGLVSSPGRGSRGG